MSVSFPLETSPRRSPARRVKLYVVDGELNSELARTNLERIVARYLPDGCQVEVIDVIENYQAAMEDQILVTPALVVQDPEPRITVFGNLSNTARTLAALRIETSD